MFERILRGGVIWLAMASLGTAAAVQAAGLQEAITVTPSIAKIDLTEAPPVFSLTYKNTTRTPVELQLHAEDFTALEEGWKVKFLDAAQSSSYRYTLSSWITFGTTTLALNPGEERAVQVFIDQNRLTPGGHYASILAEIKQEHGAGQVGLQGVLSSLLFVRAATGHEVEEASIQSWQRTQHYWLLPERYTLNFHNSGNVELTPYGQVEVRSRAGGLVAKGILNEESLITLPESIRKYAIPLVATRLFIYPGFYTATLHLHYGTTERSVDMEQRFFMVGSPIAVSAVAAALVAFISGGLLLRQKLRRRG